MKFYQTLLLATIMMIACSVGYGHASPPKTTETFYASIVPSFQNDVILSDEFHSDVIAAQNLATVHDVSVIQMNENNYSAAKIQAEAITSKAIILPAPKVIQLNLFIHYNLITNQSVKKPEPRARSSDILNQNKRC